MHDAFIRPIQEQGLCVNYGWTVVATYQEQAFWAEVVMDEAALAVWLKRCAERCLPPNTRYQIRKAIPAKFGRSHSMALYRHMEMDSAETGGREPEKPEISRAAGYVLVGEYVTPEAANVPGVSPQPAHFEIHDVGSGP